MAIILSTILTTIIYLETQLNCQQVRDGIVESTISSAGGIAQHYPLVGVAEGADMLNAMMQGIKDAQ